MLLSEINTLEAGTPESISALESLGLKNEWLSQICLKALAAFNQATHYDAASAAGSYAYFAAVRAKREILCPQGWQLMRQNNLEITRSPNDNMAIIVSSGDENTGIRDKVPKTKNPKGRQTKMVVYQNHEQMPLPFPLLDNMEQNDKKVIELGPTWILLYHIDSVNSELRMELSLPIEMDIDELKVSGWNTRIILEPIDLHDPIKNLEQEIKPEYNSEPEIRIIRRKNE